MNIILSGLFGVKLFYFFLAFKVINNVEININYLLTIL